MGKGVKIFCKNAISPLRYVREWLKQTFETRV